MIDSPQLRAIASTYLSEGAEVGYQLAFERIRVLESRLASSESQLAAMREALRKRHLEYHEDLNGSCVVVRRKAEGGEG